MLESFFVSGKQKKGRWNIVHELETLFFEMVEYYRGDPKRIQHFTKVHSFARRIGIMENLSEEEQLRLEAAAYTHDIGIRKAEELYGECHGKLQEELGPDIAKEMLEKIGFSEDVVERVCFLIGHHHTYDRIEGADYQILVEADFLVNLYEDECSKEAVERANEKIFRTKSGKKLLKEMYAL